MVDCFVKTVRHEGFFALFKGLWPNYIKVGSSRNRPDIWVDVSACRRASTERRFGFRVANSQVVPSIAIAFVTYEQLKALMGVDFKISE